MLKFEARTLHWKLRTLVARLFKEEIAEVRVYAVTASS